MPYKCPIERAAYNKQYRIDNIEKVKQHDKQFYLDNIEKIQERYKQYYLDNIEKMRQRDKQRNQSDNRKKSNKIGGWKHKKIITDDYEFLYEWYNSIDNCLNCGIELINGTGVSNHKHLDHDHITGEPCIVVCGYCNINILK